MFECMRIDNKRDVFSIEKTNNNKYVIFKHDANALMKTNAVLYDDYFLWSDIEPFETLERCYNLMESHIDDLM